MLGQSTLTERVKVESHTRENRVQHVSKWTTLKNPKVIHRGFALCVLS